MISWAKKMCFFKKKYIGGSALKSCIFFLPNMSVLHKGLLMQDWVFRLGPYPNQNPIISFADASS